MLYQAAQNSVQVLRCGLQHAKIILLKEQYFQARTRSHHSAADFFTTWERYVFSCVANFFGQWWASADVGRRSAKAPHLGLRKLKSFKREKGGHDMKVKLPKREPHPSLFMAVKLALGSVEMALQKCGAWAPLQFETAVEKSNARTGAPQPSFCRDMAKGEAVSRPRFQQRGL